MKKKFKIKRIFYYPLKLHRDIRQYLNGQLSRCFESARVTNKYHILNENELNDYGLGHDERRGFPIIWKLVVL